MKVLNFPLQKFIHNVFDEVKRKQDEITRKKTTFLYREAYKYFLDLYLTKKSIEQKVDFPAFAYLAGAATCDEAKILAEQAVLNIIKNNRINQCYTKRIKELRKRQKVN